jgi:hypothetical protein
MRTVILFAMLALASKTVAAPQVSYEKRATRADTVIASLKTAGLPTLEGKWYFIGPFDNSDNQGFDFAFPPEKEIDLKKSYPGKGARNVAWKEVPALRPGRMFDLGPPGRSNDMTGYLFLEISAKEPIDLPISLGSDDTLSVWLNGKRLLHENVVRPAAPDQNETTLPLKAGKNELLIKVGNIGGEWRVYVAPELPKSVSAQIRNQLNRDFPIGQPSVSSSLLALESAHYRIETVPVPPDVVLEVGGLGFRPDGKLLACTRRGDIWLIEHPDFPEKTSFKRFAEGLHEPLGLWVQDNRTVYVVQRPELTRITDRDGDGRADAYETICDRWGVSGDYHEFSFGPARDRDGNFFITLNVGFGGGHQAKTPWRGWCIKIDSKGQMTPIATGLRSPNGVNFSPDGDLFYCDNQGEWVATNKMHHIRPGDFFGHQAGLKWVPESMFAGRIADKIPSGMRYDGQPGSKGGPAGMPRLDPPCIWFPYGRMGQSASEPIWDTAQGKFGPFAGQCFVGDQTTSVVTRVVLEKVNGNYQGACIPFRSGFQCGINRLTFAPDGSLYAGQTNRGWGSRGGKPYGLQRLVYTGLEPFEIHAMKITRDGFDVTFTKALDEAAASKLSAFSLRSFTYNYWSTYGSPEVDGRAEKIDAVRVAPDRRSLTLAVSNRRPGRVYELRLDGVKSAAGDPLLHPEAYYTLNILP